MAILLFRTLLVYVLIIGAMRLMGKKQLGELQPSELVSTILISNLASISIESPELPLIGSVVPVFIIVATEILLSALCVRSRRAAKLVSGSPRVIIRNGVIDQATLFDLRFTVDDLLEALRGKDVFELSDVAFAIVETNGSVSVLKKFPRDTPCNEDLHIEPPTAKQPSLPLLVDGVLNPVNMRLYSVDADWIDAQCRNAGLARKDVLLFLCNDAKETSIKRKPVKTAFRIVFMRCFYGAGYDRSYSAACRSAFGRQPLCSFSCNTICPGPAFRYAKAAGAQNYENAAHQIDALLEYYETRQHLLEFFISRETVKTLQSACMACQPMRTAKPYRTCSARSTKQASRSMPWSIYFSASSDAVSRPCVARLFSRSFNSSMLLISPNWRYTDAKRTCYFVDIFSSCMGACPHEWT